MHTASTFEIRGSSWGRIKSQLETRIASEAGGAVGIVFCSEGLVDRLGDIAEALMAGSTPSWVVASGRAVLSDQGELDDPLALVGMVLRGVSPTFVPTDKVNADFGNRLGLALRRARGSALVLLRADHVDDGWLEALDQQSRSGQLGTFGGGTVPDADIVAVQDGQILRCPGLALVLAGGLKSSVIASSACRLLSPLLEVSAAEASMILELAGGAALDQLRLAAEQSDPETPILLAIAADQSALSAAGRNLALRPLTGVDPIRGGIQTNEALPLGTKVAFAARDPHAARKDLEAHLRSASRNSAGTAPHFGLYVNCAARGASLYGTANVDSKIIQSHFPQMPFIGFTSAFELAPLNRKVTPHIYTGVLSIFSKPS